MKAVQTWLTLLLLTAALSACGWQLRGAPVSLALGSVSLSGGSFDIKDILTEALESSDITVNQQASYRLKLEGERFDRRTVAVDAQGRTAEIELNYYINWRLHDQQGEALTEKGRVNLIRHVHYDPDNTTASSDEERATKEAMYEDAAWQILRQLNAASAYLFEENAATAPSATP